jgi:hypothetical protein
MATSSRSGGGRLRSLTPFITFFAASVSCSEDSSMANVLVWKDDEGYDIHVLRGEAPSKPLDESFVNLEPSKSA